MRTETPSGDVAAPVAPRLAVVVPIFRHSTLLSEAIDSVLAQQADFAIRLILVNDGCPHLETDTVCLDYARAYPDRVVYLRKANGGLSDARNHGIRYVLDHELSVEAVYLLDADNRLRPHAMARAMAALARDPSLGWVYPNIDMFGMTQHFDYGGPYSRLVHSEINTCEAGSLISRKVFEAGVMFDTNFKQGFEDWEFFLTAGSAGFTACNIEDFGFLYRKRPESMLADSERDGAGIRAVMRTKHKSFFQARSLIALEQSEAPRFAIFVTDKREVRLTTDPAAASQTISLEDYDTHYWRAYANPSRHSVPPILLVISEATLQALAVSGTLYWAIWELEKRTETADLAMLHLTVSETERVSVSFSGPPDLDQMKTSAVMIRPQSLRAIMSDKHSAWIDSLNTEKPTLDVSIVDLQITEAALGNLSSPGLEAAWDFLSLVHRLRRSKWREGAMQTVEWRVGDIRQRGSSHTILRKCFDGVPVYPRIPDGRRHVGLLLPIVEFGGVEKVALNMAQELKSAGYAVHLFVLMRFDSEFSTEWRDAVESISFFKGPEFNRWDSSDPTFYGSTVFDWAQNGKHGDALAMLHWLDVAIYFHGGATIGIMGQLRRMGIKTVNSLHLADMTPTHRTVAYPYLGLAYEHAFDLVAPCSLQLADWLHGMGIPQEKIVPVVNAPSFPISPTILARNLADRTTRDPAAPLRVMYLGRLDPQKGLERLSEVVEESSGLNVIWRIIGKSVVIDGAIALSEAVMRVLEPAVTTQAELIEAFAWADVVVLLSEYEGLPLTILEAMRQGVVVIATDVGAVSEVLRDKENGVLLALSGAGRSCLSTLRRLSVDRVYLRRLSKQAAADMVGRDWESAVSGLLSKLGQDHGSGWRS